MDEFRLEGALRPAPGQEGSSHRYVDNEDSGSSHRYVDTCGEITEDSEKNDVPGIDGHGSSQHMSIIDGQAPIISAHDHSWDFLYHRNQSGEPNSGPSSPMTTIEEMEEDLQETNMTQSGEPDLDVHYELVNGIPKRKTKAPRIWTCPRCFGRYTRKKSVEIHWGKCVEAAGNPQNLKYDDRVTATPYDPEHALYDPYSTARLRRTTKESGMKAGSKKRVQKAFVLKEYKHGSLIRVQRGACAPQQTYREPPLPSRSQSCPADHPQSVESDLRDEFKLLELPKGWPAENRTTRARPASTTEHNLHAQDSSRGEKSVTGQDRLGENDVGADGEEEDSELSEVSTLSRLTCEWDL